ncbi:MAG: ABC transporter permease subunit [Thermodesulfovibrio sp.]|nr:ABC transporter permease subunit [Thermodesulfovibrio sp.]
MGATKLEVVKDVVLPYSKLGVLGGVGLSLGRVLGETMAVAFLLFIMSLALAKIFLMKAERK